MEAVVYFLCSHCVLDQVSGAGAGEVGKSTGSRLREMTFLSFASLEYDGNVYMTPDDFLQSIVDDQPRREFVCQLP